ncbi:hypothetical protein SUGI_0306930 [Cryptomeria japonica]|uniref:LOB domain-containing protein 1 n=1 Tax=Cryptomeria japonica TaxID=3369 RepID=UPI002408D2F3|nr:LOB domain-containing protein 1 [Cryptomeria japonica]GLJ17625.1 hypothetical protein SUGI_0306930 [Cryptomeria japonica]
MARCAGCKRHRKKCSERCVLAPHFPSTDPHKFEIVHRVFGTRHILKTLQGMEADQRIDAVNSMVYEASIRLKDPVHGCATQVQQLQKQIVELKSQLAATQAEVVKKSLEKDELLALLIGGYQNDGEHVFCEVQTTDNLTVDDVEELWKPLWEE